MPYKNKQDRSDHYAKNRDAFQRKRREYYIRDRNKFLLYERAVGRRHSVLRRALKKEGIPESDLLWNRHFYSALIQDDVCHYCFSPLNQTGGGLDRIDNSAGHTCFNVVPCCRKCNRIKGNDTSYEEMMLLAPALKEIFAKRHSLDFAESRGQ